MRLFVDAHEGGKHLLAEAVEQKRRFAIEALAADCANELREEAARDLGDEDHRRLPRGVAPAAEPPHRALARARADLAHGLELLAVTRHRVPVIALHAVTVVGDDRATHAVARARIGADETVAVAVHAITAVTRHARAFLIGDARIHRARRRFALLRELDRALGGDVPRVIEIEIGDRARHERRVGEPRAPSPRWPEANNPTCWPSPFADRNTRRRRGPCRGCARPSRPRRGARSPQDRSPRSRPPRRRSRPGARPRRVSRRPPPPIRRGPAPPPVYP